VEPTPEVTAPEVPAAEVPAPEVPAAEVPAAGLAQGPVVASTQACMQWMSGSETAAMRWYTRQSMVSPDAGVVPFPSQLVPTLNVADRVVTAVVQRDTQEATEVIPASRRPVVVQTALYNWQYPEN